MIENLHLNHLPFKQPRHLGNILYAPAYCDSYSLASRVTSFVKYDTYNLHIWLQTEANDYILTKVACLAGVEKA